MKLLKIIFYDFIFLFFYLDIIYDRTLRAFKKNNIRFLIKFSFIYLILFKTFRIIKC